MAIGPRHILIASIAATLCATNLHAEVIFASWGGAYEASQQKAYVDTWQGGKVVFKTYGGGLEQVRDQVHSGNVVWDIVDVLPHEARLGCDEGLFEELDRGIFRPASKRTSSR